MIRDLKYFKWVYHNKQIILVDKVRGKSLTLPMTMADSFVRAYISFKGRYYTEQKEVLREELRNRNSSAKIEIKRLKELLKTKNGN